MEKIDSEGAGQKTQVRSARLNGGRLFPAFDRSLWPSAISVAGGDFVPPVPATRSCELLSGCRGGENRLNTCCSQLPSPGLRVYFLQDANWDTTAVVGFNSTTGAWGVTQRYVYSPYGSITVLNADWTTTPVGTQPVVNNLYQGMMLDAVTGLYYERFRNYSPSLGTWISQDPLSYVNGANTYQFVESGPVDAADAGGLRLSFTDAQNLIPPPWQVTAVTRVTYTQDFHGPGTTTEDGWIFRTYTTIEHGTRTSTYHVHAEEIKNGVLCTRSFTIVRTRKMTVKIVTNNKDSIDFFANGLQWEGTGVGVIGSAITFVDPITGIIGVGAGGLMIIGGGVLGWMSGNDEVPPSVNVSPGTVVSTSLLP